MSPYTSSDLPGNHAGHMLVPLFGLAPGGVYPATDITTSAVRSYRTFSPLPNWRFVFCGTFRRLTPPRCYLAPCPVEPGLSSPCGAIVWSTPTMIVSCINLTYSRTGLSVAYFTAPKPRKLSAGRFNAHPYIQRPACRLRSFSGRLSSL